MRVHRGEMRWPNGLAQIARVGKQSVSEAQGKRIFDFGADSSAGALRLHGNDCAGSGEGKQGEFLDNERWEPSLGCLVRVLVRRTHTAERPIIPQQQDKWKRNHLRLRYQSQATDSTLIGCKAKSAATAKLLQVNPVARCRIRNNSIALIACSQRLT